MGVPAPEHDDAAAFWEQLLARSVDLEGVGHGGFGPRYNEFLYRAKARAFRAALARNSLSLAGASVADIGCGTGFFSALAKNEGCAQLVGIDISSTAVARLNEHFPEFEFLQADIAEPGADAREKLGRFDVVLCFDVIYHVVAPERFAAAVDALWGLVEENGHLLLVDAFSRRELIPGGTLEPTEHHVPHVRFRSRREYESTLFARRDFELVDLVPMYYLFNRPMVGNHFPWTSPRLSWHLRRRVLESRLILHAMYALDGMLAPRMPANSSLKVLVARKRAVRAPQGLVI
jgi:SAM-dependent methyltransferase